MASAQPAEPILAGFWEGVITGREMATATGCCEEQPVRLLVNDDGTWSMTTATWKAAGRVKSRTQSFLLEGDFISVDPGQRLGPALYHLDHVSRWENRFLMGNASARYKGLHITTSIALKKVQ